MRLNVSTILSAIIYVVCFSSQACQQTLYVPLIESNKDKLITALLSLSVNKSGNDICIRQIDKSLTEARKSMFVDKGLIDVQWASKGSRANRLLKPIPEAIFRGLGGYRIFVIRKGEQARFDKIFTLDDLKKLTAGQGDFWGIPKY
ncbi:hypothetical protein [Catenovulum sediminis]|uniref:hypothetical protein n=1 Tax=Catenovulum sediminis TaxID=1740262 RepID=UPI0011815A16|nr:hypothetical protein [Catenovulum sediminis]